MVNKFIFFYRGTLKRTRSRPKLFKFARTMNPDGFPNTFDELIDAGSDAEPHDRRALAESDPEDVIADGPAAGPSVAPRVPARVFRFQGKRGFFTFPKLDMDPSAALVKFLAWRPMERAMVCRESHSDGTKHLHVLFWAKNRVDLRSYTSLDAILGKHGNYQVMKDPVASVRYLMKEKDFVSFGFDPVEYVAAAAAKRARSHKWETVVEVLQKGGSLAKFEDQAFVARNLRSLLAYATWWKTLNPTYRVKSAAGVDWRCRTVVVWGLPGVGKSYWAEHGGGLPGAVWVLPTQRTGGVWWDGYDGSPTLVLEDFDSALMGMLTLFRALDSYKFVGPVKCTTGGMTADWINVIITNNHHPHDWYKEASHARTQALDRRIKICYVEGTAWRTKTFDELYSDVSWPESPAAADNLVE